MDTENLKFLSIENGTLCNEEIDEGENFENSEMKPKNFKIFIYIFQCNVTKARNFEENFKDFTMNLSNSKKYEELQYINSYFTTWQRKIGKKILWAQQIPRYLSHPTWKICSNPFKNSINIQQIIIFESIYQISRKIQLCFLLCLKKKKERSQIPIGRDFDFIRYFVSSHQTRVGENTMEWNKGSHGREIVPFSRLNFIMRGEIESRRSITRGSREIPRRFSRPTPPPQNSSHSRLAFSVSVENLACGGCASTPAADTKSEHVRSRRRASLQRCFVTFLLSKTVRLGCLGSF